jgi:hypothetical protein
VLALGESFAIGLRTNDDLRVEGVKGRSGSESQFTVSGFTEHEHSRHYWSEGSEGMVSAFWFVGEVELARSEHSATRQLAMDFNDPKADALGVPYTIGESTGQSRRCSVAGTAWFLFNEWSEKKKKLVVNPFRPSAG